jgi:AMP-polyphosphate phosphotransferase
LILPLDPRGFTVHSARGPTEEQAFYPFLWRFWKQTPTRGRLAIFDRSWNRRGVTADEGVVIVKCFLHISKNEQKRRLTLCAGAQPQAGG